MVVMHIVKNRSEHGKKKKIYQSTLLMESYRENGKVKKRTIANLSHCSEAEIDAMALALKHKGDLGSLKSVKEVVLEEGLSVGSVWLGYQIAKEVGIEEALGVERVGKLAMWQVLARVLDQGSRLSAVRLGESHALCDVLGIREGFNEDDLYKNLGWLSENQEEIERRLYQARKGKKSPELFLYDVTSSYLEGVKNELGNYGYNRDGKRGKQQIVIGLLCDEEGGPIAVEVFEGHTNDSKTVANQIEKIRTRFQCKRVTLVGDRGMLKQPNIKDFPENFSFITAITKPQIESLIKTGNIQLALFDSEVSEIKADGYRYILRRNPVRAKEIACNREEKFTCVTEFVTRQNQHLIEHPKSKTETYKKRIQVKMERLGLQKWVQLNQEGRVFSLSQDPESLKKISELDGCYVLKTDLDPAVSAPVIHDRYKDLALVEQAFRNMKTVVLDARPIYVRTAKSTRGHVFVVMLAYLLIWKLRQAWKNIDCTIAEGLQHLSTLSSIKVTFKNTATTCHKIPKPRPFSQALLNAANVILPDALPSLNTLVVTRKKLVPHRV